MVNKTTENLEQERRGEQGAQLVMSARLALRREQRSEAKKLLAQALKIDSADIGALELLGDIFLEDAEQEKALQVFAHGQKHHPDYAPFEEKLAQAHLDIAEMERDRQAKQDAIELGVVGDPMLDRKASLASGLSCFMPGAGQVYNDQYEKAAAHFGLALVCVLIWVNMLLGQIQAGTRPPALGPDGTPQGRGYVPGWEEALNDMGSAQRTFFWLMVVAWIVTVIVSAADAAMAAQRINEERRRHLGI